MSFPGVFPIFGIGALVCRRTDVPTPTPNIMAVLQDVHVSFDQQIKELYGQTIYAVAVATGQQKITCKAKNGEFFAQAWNDMFFGQTLTTASGQLMALNEQHTAAASVTVTNSATFVEDLGVRYITCTATPANNGKPLTRVASAPTVGQYSVAAGVYTFNASEAGTLTFYYSYTVTTASKIAIANQLAGFGPIIEANLQASYTLPSGVLSTMQLTLNNCRPSKMDTQFKNMDFAIPEFDFTAFADSSGNIGTLTITQ